MGVIRLGDKNFCINKNRGILIVFEGISGCGKSEGADNLYRYLQEEGFKTEVIEWNSNKVIRSIVKRIHSANLLTARIYSILQWIGLLIDYFLKVAPLLKKDYILIADRYVYTGQTRDVANGAGKKAGTKFEKLIRKPDLILFYNVDLQVCYERIEKRGKVLFRPDRRHQNNETLKNENLEYLIKLHNEYVKVFSDPYLTDKTNIIFLAGNNDLETLQVRKSIDEYIKLKTKSGYFVDENIICKLS